ncbi:MAG: hypothetical protein IPG63_12670 [Xanthomonadales bacterium]|nr:hypothetical protein [Xanthomonadales bacterium]MBK7145240.1 hypothetical protein [Xanthomonadales bacterium]
MAGTNSLRLTQAEAREVLSARLEGILVGGQALAMWADYYGVAPPSALAAGLTSDLDFLGTRFDARRSLSRLVNTLDAAPGYREATLSDATTNSARIWIHGFHDRRDPIGIDYLNALIGYSREDEDKLRSNAVEMTVGDITLKLMHPIDCLLSRARNVERLPEKRGSASIAQCRLAIEVVKAYLSEVCQGGAGTRLREQLKAAERIATLARSDAGIYLKTEFDVDVLDAVPIERIESREFREIRWPQVRKSVAEAIETLKRQRERRRKHTKPA